MNQINEKALTGTLNRRKYLRLMGQAAIVTLAAPHYGFAKSKYDTTGIFAEACDFKNKGGWVLDTQFYQQMGGCCLLAHGMGKPVENAKTTINSSSAGSFYLHVRTKDWCPGRWEAPGKFNVIVNGVTVKTTFGTLKGWSWQFGGVLPLKKGKNSIELKDLTGFEGRVDGLYFSKAKSPKLPNTPKDLMDWKDQVTGRHSKKVASKKYDVVIVGGGMTGCAAALAADSKGLKVALVQDRPLFGGNASQEVRVHSLGIYGKNEKLIRTIDTFKYPNGDPKAKIDQVKREKAMAASNVDLFPSTLAIGLSKNGNRVMSVDGRNTSTGFITRFSAPQFIDCTGDGWLGFWGGAEYRYGRESYKQHDEHWDKYGELWAPKKADNKVMGASVLWYSSKGKKPSRFPRLPWAAPIAKDHKALKGEWFWEYSANHLHQIHDAEEIRDNMFRAIYGSFSNAKRSPSNALWELDWVAYVGGRRESRRIMGDYLYSMKDMKDFIQHPDDVVEESRLMDGHYQLAEKGSKYNFISTSMHYYFGKSAKDELERVGGWTGIKKTSKLYYLPFRSLYSKDLDNLMMAGRCFSCTHIGLGGPRVMNTCAQMGIATGYAAVLGKKHKATPRQVGQKHIKELRKLIGYT